jgi:hypothetical protein
MNYNEFYGHVRRAGLNLKDFALLIKMTPASLTNYSKKGKVPTHLAVIATLLGEMHEKKVDYKDVLSQINISTKRPRGVSHSAKFGRDRKIDLDEVRS